MKEANLSWHVQMARQCLGYVLDYFIYICPCVCPYNQQLRRQDKWSNSSTELHSCIFSLTPHQGSADKIGDLCQWAQTMMKETNIRGLLDSTTLRVNSLLAHKLALASSGTWGALGSVCMSHPVSIPTQTSLGAFFCHIKWRKLDPMFEWDLIGTCGYTKYSHISRPVHSAFTMRARMKRRMWALYWPHLIFGKFSQGLMIIRMVHSRFGCCFFWFDGLVGSGSVGPVTNGLQSWAPSWAPGGSTLAMCRGTSGET